MHTVRQVFRRCLTFFIISLLVGIAPAPAFADTPSDTATPTTQTTATPNNGPQGSDSGMFHYDASTGLWVSQYYTYDPSTQVESPITAPEYTYNSDTGKWDTTIWQYIAADNSYHQESLSVSQPPAGAITHGGPVAAPDTSNQTTQATVAPTEDPAAASTAAPQTTSDNNQQSSDPDNKTTSSGSSTVNNQTTAGMDNTITANATSGSAMVQNNNNIGTVATGNGTDIANVVNMLQTQASLNNSGLATFTTNIQGNVSGDLLIDPATLGMSSPTSQSNLANAQINNVTDGSINNTINLAANSGNATADNNNNVNIVKTGDANAIADVVNMINSVVAANQSFLGVINIYGDYTGNILMPADSLNALLSSAGPSVTGDTSSNVNNTASSSIANNVDLSAISGTATASNNNDVGTVATGNALTNLTILNLTGHQVIAANSLLVFVNVLGTWVGLIMDAPAGATSAALGGGVSGNTTLAQNTGINNTVNSGITNNITAAATSGNSTATNNNNVGTVASGNATASANIANFINNNFSLSNWFGILFINVFGSWHGNFGVVTPAPLVPPITSGAAGPFAGAGGDGVTDARVFAFVPKSGSNPGYKLSPLAHVTHFTMGNVTTPSGTNGGGSNGTNGSTPGLNGAMGSVRTAGEVLTSAPAKNVEQNAAQVKQAVESSFNLWSVILLTIGAAGFGLVGVERVRSNLRAKTTSKS